MCCVESTFCEGYERVRHCAEAYSKRQMHERRNIPRVASERRNASFLLLATFLASFVSIIHAQRQQDPFAINGGSILAMAGKESVAVAVDKRFGSGPQMVTVAPRLVWIPHPFLMVAFVGLDGDVQSLSETLQVEIHGKLNRALGLQLSSSSTPPPSSSSTAVGREKEASVLRQISPLALASLTSHVLYQNRGKFYVEPLIAGLRLRRRTTRGVGSGSTNGDDDEGEHLVPFLCGMDSIGAQSLSDSFVCSGAASSSLYGTAEALWRPNLEPDELVEACGKAFQSALERDCLSGYGVLVYLITKDGVVEHDLASRND